ncbi:hypothetical protein NKG05_24785 [Oerskovia sp. M15]
MSGPSLGPGSRVVLIGDSITDAGRLAEGSSAWATVTRLASRACAGATASRS